jgi:hypothetical protein
VASRQRWFPCLLGGATRLTELKLGRMKARRETLEEKIARVVKEDVAVVP